MGLGITDLKLLLTLETLRPVWGNNIESPSDFPSVTGVSDILYKFIWESRFVITFTYYFVKVAPGFLNIELIFFQYIFEIYEILYIFECYV